MSVDFWDIPEESGQAWLHQDIGGLIIRLSPDGETQLYELHGDGFLVSVSNSVKYDWADLELYVSPKVKMRVANTSLREPRDAPKDPSSVYVSFGFTSKDEYPVAEMKIHRTVAEYLRDALTKVLEAE